LKEVDGAGHADIEQRRVVDLISVGLRLRESKDECADDRNPTGTAMIEPPTALASRRNPRRATFGADSSAP
jgi:hypothetical protein